MAADLRVRAHTPELMDTDCRSFADYATCLADLASVNRLTLTHRATIRFLDRLRREGRISSGKPLRLLDVASGHGDLLRLVDRWSERNGIPVALTGVDLNPWAAQAATAATAPGRPIRWLTSNVFDLAPSEKFDIVVSSQFTHHLSDAEIVAFIEWMERTAGLAWLIADLRRNALAYYGFRLLAWAANWHRFVRHDGAISITRAHTLGEWQSLRQEAGMGASEVQIRPVPPFRFIIARVKP